MVNAYEDRGDSVMATTVDGRAFSGEVLVAAQPCLQIPEGDSESLDREA